jgi:uncharacterized protein YkwD
MRLINLISLLVTFTLFGCSIFKKEKTSIEEPRSNIVSIDSFAIDSSNRIPESYDLVIADSATIPPIPKQPLEYMTLEEKAMIDELNLLRADPYFYIQYVDHYIQNVMADGNLDLAARQAERYAGEELINVLKFIPPLRLLTPDEGLYKVAKKHGDYLREINIITHKGSDDSEPEDRIKDSTDLVGNEIFVVGGLSVRESVIKLLVDAKDGITRKNRKIILNPNWEFVACYNLGTVNKVPNSWVQLFGYKDPENIPSNTNMSIRSLPQEDTIITAPTEIYKPTLVGDSTLATKTIQDAADFSFMTAEEKSMIDEINLMRADPQGYIKYVDEFINEERKNLQENRLIFDSYAKELKEQLRDTKKLSMLKPHKKLYEVAKAHGIYNKKNHQMEHTDANGMEGFDRVEKAGLKNSINSKGEYAPNENLVYGYESVRNTVIYLLIDSGEPSRGHRKALLEPTWEFVACYKIGVIENMKDNFGNPGEDALHNWIQFFAMD